MELNLENRHLEFMLGFENEKRLLWGELMPYWWGQLKMTEMMKHFTVC